MTGPQTSIEPLLGWRIWHVDPRPGRVRLRSWAQTADWPTGQRLEAGCRSLLGLRWRSPEDHSAPKHGHSCGIYAFRERADAEALLEQLAGAGPQANRLPSALGRVSLWGRVFENTGGWRAQYAYPYDLTLYGGDARLAAELRDSYAVDVSLA